MKDKKHFMRGLTSRLLMLSLCLGLVVSPFAQASGAGKKEDDGKKNVKTDKVSSDLREKMNSKGGKDSSRVSVILQVAGKVTGRLNGLLNRNGVHVNGKFDNLNMFAVELPVDVVNELASYEEISYVSADREVISLGGHLSTTTGADSVRQQFNATGAGYTLDGTGIGIAFLDSGLYSAHKSFTGRVGGSRDYTGENRVDDPYGHGTHVVGVAAGNGSVDKGKYIGIAPNSTIYNLRVLNSKGLGTVSSVLAALNDLLLYHAYYNIRVVNMSLGMPAVDSYKNDPICIGVRKLVDAGVVVVAAAGNDGKNKSNEKIYGLIHAPGNEPSVITVGASNTIGTIDRGDDLVATYSSRGPTRSSWADEAGVRHYDNLMKPDLIAPGNKIVSAEAIDNYLVKSDPSLDAGVSKFANQKMMRLNGTSMATPVISGAAALLLQVNPRLTPNMVKMLLMYTAQPLNGYNMLEQGAGEVNIEGAVRLAKLMRANLTATVGESLLTTSTLPTPRTMLPYFNSATGSASYTTFTWSQGLILDHTYATGTDLITKYQGIYNKGVLLGDGVLLSDGVLLADGVLLSDGVLFGDYIMISNGTAMGGGTSFMNRGVLLGDGVLFSDGVLFGDGVLFSDGVLLSDGQGRGDNAMKAYSVLAGGD